MPAIPGDLVPTRTGPRRTRRGPRPLAVALAFLATSLVVTALVGDRGLTEFVRVRDEYRRLEADVAAAKAEHARLQEAVRRLNEDPSAIEDLARRDLGLIKPGEKLFIIRDVPGAPPR